MKAFLSTLCIAFLFFNNLYCQDEQNLKSEIESYQLSIDSINFQIEKLEEEIEKINKHKEEAEGKLKLLTLESLNDGNGLEIIAKVNNDFGPFKLFEKPGSQEIGKIPINSKIILHSQIGDFYKVRYNNKEGFISAFYLKLDSDTKDLLEELNKSEIVETTDNKTTGSHFTNTTSNNSTNTKYTRPKKKLDQSKPIHVRGYWRTTKSGKRVYVRPHTRNRSN